MLEWMQVLSEMEGTIERLTELAADKRAAVVAGDIAVIEAQVREETALLRRISLLEEQRQRAVVIYALRAGLDPKKLTLAGLLDTLPPSADKDDLSAIRVRLSEKMQNLEGLNRINAELLETQRDITGFMLESTANPTQLGTQYSGNGRDADMQNHVRLIDRNA